MEIVEQYSLNIDGDRLWQRLMAMAEIGATAGGGVNRQALSYEEHHAWRQLIEWAKEFDAEPFIDAVGNLFLRLPGENPLARPILIGSHLDSQPQGGRFDGVFGVMAAFEILQTLATSQLPRPRDVVAVAWMNEEGSRFAPGMMGSEVFVGKRDLATVRSVCDANEISVGEALDTQFAAFPDLLPSSPGFPVHAYIEPHIEQGTRLEQANCSIGVVTGIQGKLTYRVRLVGAPGHAGTQPMAERRDALMAFADIAVHLQKEIGHYDERIKLTIGHLNVTPNVPSVVPQAVTFSLDLRHPDNAVLKDRGMKVTELIQAYSGECRVEVEPLVVAPSNDFDESLRGYITKCAEHRGYPVMPVLSAAGHDARYLAQQCPSAMIFIPCRNGVSHAEHEWAEPKHVTAGANVLLDVVVTLLTQIVPANEESGE